MVVVLRLLLEKILCDGECAFGLETRMRYLYHPPWTHDVDLALPCVECSSDHDSEVCCLVSCCIERSIYAKRPHGYEQAAV